MSTVDLIIKIPEEKYNYIKKQVAEGIDNPLKVYIANGTPLPKGHKRLIEDDFEVGPVYDKEGYVVGYRYVTQEDLDNALTIIEADEESEEQEIRGMKKYTAKECCTCWHEYPNPYYSKDGCGKCLEQYKNVRQTDHVSRKTKCILIDAESEE